MFLIDCMLISRNTLSGNDDACRDPQKNIAHFPVSSNRDIW
jgi:hypothetical protein